jgi:hypothetical protein
MLRLPMHFSGFSANAIPRAKEFYGRTLGLKVSGRREPFAFTMKQAT